MGEGRWAAQWRPSLAVHVHGEQQGAQGKGGQDWAGGWGDGGRRASGEDGQRPSLKERGNSGGTIIPVSPPDGNA